MNDQKDRKTEKGNGAKPSGKPEKTRGDAAAKAGPPFVSISAEHQHKQDEHLHRDPAREMHDQLTGAAGDDPKLMKSGKTDDTRKPK